MHSDEPDLPLGRVMTPVSPAPWPCTISSPSPSCLPFLLLSFFLSTSTFLPVPSILLRPTSPTPPPHPLLTYPFSPPSPHSSPHPPNPLPLLHPSPGAWRGAHRRVPRGKRTLGRAGLIYIYMVLCSLDKRVFINLCDDFRESILLVYLMHPGLLPVFR